MLRGDFRECLGQSLLTKLPAVERTTIEFKGARHRGNTYNHTTRPKPLEINNRVNASGYDVEIGL